jgi:hypothetical protein
LDVHLRAMMKFGAWLWQSRCITGTNSGLRAAMSSGVCIFAGVLVGVGVGDGLGVVVGVGVDTSTFFLRWWACGLA